MNTIVTHIRPDLDALTSSWFVKRYMPGWESAQMSFVPAGTTLNGAPPDADDTIVHVDTGRGKFDHHQFKAKLSATLIVHDYLRDHNHIPDADRDAAARLAAFVNVIDNFGEVYFPDPAADVYDLSIGALIDGLGFIEPDDHNLAALSFPIIDASLAILRKKVDAEREIEKGESFTSAWGASLALLTTNEETVKLAQKKGYTLVARKDPERGFVRVKTPPEPKYDLTALYNKLKHLDPKADWFLHSSLNMLLNGSSKNPNVVASVLTLDQVVAAVKDCAL